MGLLDNTSEDPQSRKRRYLLMLAAAVVIVIGGGFFLYYSYFHIPERRVASHFFTTITAGNFPAAYQLWKADPAHYAYKDFMDDWGPNGYYGPVKSFRIEGANAAPKDGSGVIVTVELSPNQPFPDPNDIEKSGHNKEVHLWVETRDKSLSFGPPNF
jgi:hypothetical protein